MAFLYIWLMFAVGAVSAAPLTTWTVPWDPAPTEALACFDSVSPFALAFSSSGVFVASPKLLEQGRDLKARGVKVTPVVVNDVYAGGKLRELKSPTILDGLFGDEPSAARHIAELLVVAEEFDGIEIDYERVPDALLHRYSEFLRGLGQALHAKGKLLYVDLEPWPLGRSGIAARWWPELTRHVDGVRLMAYYEKGGKALHPGPGNSLEWVVATAKKAQQFIPPAKLEVAVSLAATEWKSGLLSWRGQRVHYGRAQRSIKEGKAEIQRDANGMPYAKFKHRQLWLEDAQSLDAKIDALHRSGVQRVALWYWGSDHPELNGCRQ